MSVGWLHVCRLDAYQSQSLIERPQEASQRSQSGAVADTVCTALSLSACESGQAQLDIVFVLDTSASGNEDTVFVTKNVVGVFVAYAEIGSNAIRVGLQTFTDMSLTKFNLDLLDKGAILSNIGLLGFIPSGTTNTSGWN